MALADGQAVDTAAGALIDTEARGSIDADEELHRTRRCAVRRWDTRPLRYRGPLSLVDEG
jgi:hypothetical protein